MSEFAVFQNDSGTYTVDGPDGLGQEIFEKSADAEDWRAHRLVEFVSPVRDCAMYDDLYQY
jgi:hypothetical protein